MSWCLPIFGNHLPPRLVVIFGHLVTTSSLVMLLPLPLVILLWKQINIWLMNHTGRIRDVTVEQMISLRMMSVFYCRILWVLPPPPPPTNIVFIISSSTDWLWFSFCFYLQSFICANLFISLSHLLRTSCFTCIKYSKCNLTLEFLPSVKFLFV